SNLNPPTEIGPSSGKLIWPFRPTTSEKRPLVLPNNWTSKLSPGPITYSAGTGTSVAGANVLGTPSNNSYPNGSSPCTPVGVTGRWIASTWQSASPGSAASRVVASAADHPASGIGPNSGTLRMPHLSSL